MEDANKPAEPKGLQTFSAKAHPGVGKVKGQFEKKQESESESESEEESEEESSSS